MSEVQAGLNEDGIDPVSQREDSSISTRGNLVIIGAWFGVVLGYTEGLLLCILQFFGRTQYVSAPIIWISPFLYAIVFGILGLMIWGFTHRLKPSVGMSCALLLFSLLATTDLIEIVLPAAIARYAKVILALGLALVVVRGIKSRIAQFVLLWRRSIIWLLLSVPVCAAIIHGGLWATEAYQTSRLSKAPDRAPNVLLYVIDTLRADHLSSHGYHRGTTPTIDALAVQGVRFENAYSTSSWTLPSHVSFFTGLDAHVHGVGHGRDRMPPDLPTISADLRRHGYRTGAFSANVFWITHDRVGHGFMHFEDYFQSVADMALRTMYGRAVEMFVLRRLGYEDIPARKRASDLNRAVLKWIDRDPDRPFFAFVNCFDSHDPYLPPEPFRSKFSGDPQAGGILNWRVGRAEPTLSDEQLRDEVAAYDGGIAYVDQQLKQLVNELRERDLLDDTLIIVTSDHGESFNEHGYYLHGHSLYRQQIHVPLVFCWPGHVPEGLVVSQPVSNASLPATIMEQLNLKSDSFPSPSLTAFWNGTPTSWPHPVAFAEMKDWAPPGSPAFKGDLHCVVSPQWHLIQSDADGLELYDWTVDPNESVNLADQTDLKDVVDELRSTAPSDDSTGADD